VGESTAELVENAAAKGVADMIVVSGPTSQSALHELSRRAAALLILERPASMKGHELLAGAKLFGYLKARKPILGVLPQCEARNILKDVGVSTVADVDSISDINAKLRQLVTAWSEGKLPDFAPDASACRKYSAETQTAALICALERRPAAESFTPGLIDIPRSLRTEIGAHGWVAVRN
jgi:hypothetical protein